jgi:general stress protein CsbA
VCLLAYAVFFLHPYYGSNDEFSLAAIASGAYGDYTQYFIYIHSGFGWILKGFYTLMPDLNWYTLVMYGMIFLSLTFIGFAWIGRKQKTGFLLSVLLLLCSIQPLYVEIQYTKTAAVVSAAGYVLLLTGEQKKKIRTLLPGILWLLLGSWIRFESFGMVSLLAFGLWLGQSYESLKRRDIKGWLIRNCMPCMVAFGLVFGSIALENMLVYTPGSAEAHYKEYDKARQQLLDYGVPEWDEYEAEYEALGLTRTDCINLQNWLIADYDRYTADTFKAIVAFRKARPFQWEYLFDYLVILAKKPLAILGMLATLLWLLPLKGLRKRKGRIEVLWQYLALLGIYLYFIKIYRVLPIVVTACLLSFVIFLWSSEEEKLSELLEEKLSGKRQIAAGAISVGLTGCICIHMLVSPALEPAAQSTESSAAYRELYDTITQEKDLYYVFDPFTNNGVELAYSIFEKIPQNYLTNIFTLGGWETESPQVVSNLEAYGQRSLLTSLYLSDRAVLISDTLMEHIMLHLQDIYDGIFITYSKVNQIGNFDLFALNYKMSGLKDSEEYSATLDKTYTAENDRYDVFEATVNMTPEELEGKSVFLWMESVESGKKRMYQGTWQQQDENGLYSMLYDTDLEDTNQVRFMIPKMSYPLDDRYEVHIVIRSEEKGMKLITENHLYE